MIILRQKEFGKLDKQLIVDAAKKKGINLKISEITPEMLHDFRYNRKEQTRKKLFETDYESYFDKSFRKKINGRINSKALYDRSSHFNQSASAATLREGTNLQLTDGPFTATREGARAKKRPNAMKEHKGPGDLNDSYDHGGSISSKRSENNPDAKPSISNYIRHVNWTYKYR